MKYQSICQNIICSNLDIHSNGRSISSRIWLSSRSIDSAGSSLLCAARQRTSRTNRI